MKKFLYSEKWKKIWNLRNNLMPEFFVNDEFQLQKMQKNQTWMIADLFNRKERNFLLSNKKKRIFIELLSLNRSFHERRSSWSKNKRRFEFQPVRSSRISLKHWLSNFCSANRTKIFFDQLKKQKTFSAFLVFFFNEIFTEIFEQTLTNHLITSKFE